MTMPPPEARRDERQRLARAETRARHLAAIIESSHDAVIGCDLDGRIVSWNPAARHLYGHRDDEAVGQPLDLLTEADQQDEWPRLMSRLRRGERVEHYETVHCRRDGSPVAVSLSVSPVRGDDGELSGASLIVRDITATRRTEAALRLAHRELETLIGTVAHELRAPVLGSRGLLRLVRSEIAEPSSDLETYLDRLESSLEWSDHLLDELTAIAEARLAERRPTVVDSGSLADQVAAAVRGAAAEREVHIEVDDHLPQLWCRADALRQVLRHLLMNAVQFTAGQSSAHIEIGWQDGEPSQAVLWVRDDGPGIPRGEQGRVFDMFYRRHGPGRQGPGLGLALVQRLVQAMGGSVWLESEVGRGSTFFVALPRPPGDAS